MNLSSSRSHQVNALAVISIALVLLLYVWLGSFGFMNHLPTITTYYDKLATAFMHGNLALEEQPDPALLALENVFDRSKWHGIDVPTDYSLYKGKYYLYFGPVPAVMLTAAKLLGSGTKGDQYPAFAFICGVFILQSLLLLLIWKKYFSHLSIWLVPLGIFFAGLASPFPWVLTRSRFFEAASIGGQFFFLLGLYLLLTSQTIENTSKWKLLAAGTSWALAMGSRPTLVFPMAVTVVMFAVLEYSHYLRHKQIRRSVYPFAIALLPFAVGVGILGWYNWARFDSPFEFGFSYQLAGPDIQGHARELFSQIYVLPDLYNYFVNKPVLIEKFPLVMSAEGMGQSIFSAIKLPSIYYTGEITGILHSTPLVWFSLILLFPRKKQNGDMILAHLDSFQWTVILLTGVFLAEFIPFVSYFWVETRFFADFTPPLIVLSVMGFWKGYDLLKEKTGWLGLYVLVGVGLSLFSMWMGIALGLAAHAGEFREYNPIVAKALYRKFIPEFWKTLYNILSR